MVFEWEEEKTFWRVRQVFRIFDVLWRYRSVSQGTKADCGIAELGRLQGCEFRPGVGWAKKVVARAKGKDHRTEH